MRRESPATQRATPRIGSQSTQTQTLMPSRCANRNRSKPRAGAIGRIQITTYPVPNPHHHPQNVPPNSCPRVQKFSPSPMKTPTRHRNRSASRAQDSLEGGDEAGRVHSEVHPGLIRVVHRRRRRSSSSSAPRPAPAAQPQPQRCRIRARRGSHERGLGAAQALGARNGGKRF